MTGSLSTYKGSLQFVPTAQTILSANGTPPPMPTVTMADVAPTGNSQYRGVLVKLASGTKLTVDNVTPAALVDTECTTEIASDAGADGGVLSCASLCEPPAYSGFTANDGQGNEANIEQFFFATDTLQSSPECLSQPNVVPVMVGMTFSSMQGILDVDPYASQQALYPVLNTDYTTP